MTVRAAWRIQRDLREILYPLVGACLLGILYGVYRHPVAWAGVVTGALAGTLICGGLLAVERVAFTARRSRTWAKRPMWQFVGLRLAVYLVVALAGLSLSHLFGDRLLPRDHLHGIRLTPMDVAIAFSVSLAFVWLSDLARFMGGRVLIDLLFGRQRVPRHERRVFLMADVVGSSEAARRLGDFRYHAWLSDIFHDAAEAVADHGGEIYRYVGDQIVVSWALADQDDAGVKALGCAFAIEDALLERRRYFRTTYARVPTLRFTLHAGAVVAGETGHLRREIVYLGEVVNDAAHLEQMTKDRCRRVVASDCVVDGLGLPSGVAVVERFDVASELGSMSHAYSLERVPRSPRDIAELAA